MMPSDYTSSDLRRIQPAEVFDDLTTAIVAANAREIDYAERIANQWRIQIAPDMKAEAVTAKRDGRGQVCRLLAWHGEREIGPLWDMHESPDSDDLEFACVDRDGEVLAYDLAPAGFHSD